MKSGAPVMAAKRKTDRGLSDRVTRASYLALLRACGRSHQPEWRLSGDPIPIGCIDTVVSAWSSVKPGQTLDLVRRGCGACTSLAQEDARCMRSHIDEPKAAVAKSMMRAFRASARFVAWLAIVAMLASAAMRLQQPTSAAANVIHDEVLGAIVLCSGQAQADTGTPDASPPHCPLCTAAVAAMVPSPPPALAVRIAFALPPEPAPAPSPIPAAPAPTELGSRAPPLA